MTLNVCGITRERREFVIFLLAALINNGTNAISVENNQHHERLSRCLSLLNKLGASQRHIFANLPTHRVFNIFDHILAYSLRDKGYTAICTQGNCVEIIIAPEVAEEDLRQLSPNDQVLYDQLAHTFLDPSFSPAFC